MPNQLVYQGWLAKNGLKLELPDGTFVDFLYSEPYRGSSEVFQKATRFINERGDRIISLVVGAGSLPMGEVDRALRHTLNL